MQRETFKTPTYYTRDFGSIEARSKHLQYKIKSVVEDYESRGWKIDAIEIEGNDESANASINMSR